MFVQVQHGRIETIHDLEGVGHVAVAAINRHHFEQQVLARADRHVHEPVSVFAIELERLLGDDAVLGFVLAFQGCSSTGVITLLLNGGELLVHTLDGAHLLDGFFV